MKRLSLAAMLAVFLVAPGIVRADGDDEKKDDGVRVEAKVVGKAIVVGEGGKIEVEVFCDEGELPKQRQGKPKDAEKKGTSKNEGKCSKTPAITFSKVFMIGPDGKMQELKDAPKNGQGMIEISGFGDANVSGTITVIGPDGKKHTQSFGDAGKSPKQRQGKPKDAEKKGTSDKEGNCPKWSAFGFGKAFMIGPDGKMQELKAVPNNVQDMMKKSGFEGAPVSGTITVIGPDGKEHTQSFGGGMPDAKSISKSIEKALEGTGKQVPKEVEDAIRKSLKCGVVPPQAQFFPPQAQIICGGRPVDDDISGKLDEIIKRLDKLEKEIRDLKANQQ